MRKTIPKNQVEIRLIGREADVKALLKLLHDALGEIYPSLPALDTNFENCVRAYATYCLEEAES